MYFVEERNQSTYILGEFVCEKTTLWGYGNMDYPCPVYDGDPSMVEVGDGYFIKGGELDKTGLSYDELLSFGRDENSYVEHYDTLHGWFISQLIFYAQPTIALL